MPCNRADYPPNWEAISYHIRFERAGGLCEAICADGSPCQAPHGEWILRQIINKECWQLADSETDGAIHVVLTTAHLNHNTQDNRPENLMAFCQLHHLRYDIRHHARNAAQTRSKKQGLVNLFEGVKQSC